jgi:hypothetical protein
MSQFTGTLYETTGHFTGRDWLTDVTEADTIRILIATDNHVGYEERDPIRKDDSWKTFDEIINLGRKEDVGSAVY